MKTFSDKAKEAIRISPKQNKENTGYFNWAYQMIIQSSSVKNSVVKFFAGKERLD